MSARALLSLVEEIEELVGARQQRVITYNDQQPVPLHDVNDLVIMTEALDPDPSDCGAASHPRGDGQTPIKSPVKSVEPLSLPEPSPPLDDLPAVAAAAGLYVEPDGHGNSGIWLVREGRSVLFCGPERHCREFITDRMRRPARQQAPLG